MKNTLKKSNLNIFLILIILILVSITGYLFFKKKPCNKQFSEIVKIIEKIDEKCKIQLFTNKKNSINFLNIKEFSGNHVGSIQIGDPKNWEGPYMTEIPSYKNVPLEIFVHSSGCYVIPGDGTILDDGKIIGKDILFDEKFDLNKFLEEYSSLKGLICKINVDLKDLSKEEIK